MLAAVRWAKEMTHRHHAVVSTTRLLRRTHMCQYAFHTGATPMILPSWSVCGVRALAHDARRPLVGTSMPGSIVHGGTLGATRSLCLQRSQPAPDRNGSRIIDIVELDAVGNAQRKSLSYKQLRSELRLSRRFAALIDNSMSNRHPVIDVAGHGDSLIVSVDETARVIIQTNRALLVDPATIAGERLAVTMQHALTRPGPHAPFAPEGWVTDETTRFELRVLEAVLRFVCTSLDYELQVLKARVDEVLNELAASATDEALQQLVPIKHSLSAFSTQVKEFKGSMEVNLTQPKELDQIENLIPPINHSDDLESALDSDPLERPAEQVDLAYEVLDELYWTTDEIENETAQLMANIRASEEVLAITLDKTRNQLIRLNLVATSGAFVAAVGSMAASLFGMNLHVEAFTAMAFPSVPESVLFPTVAATIGGVTSASAIGFYHWYKELNQNDKHTVLAQSVIDKLHTRYTDIESSSITRYGQHAMLTKRDFERVMNDLHLALSDIEIDALFVRLGEMSGERMSVDLLLSVVRQHAHANMVRARPTDAAGINVCILLISLEHLPMSMYIIDGHASCIQSSVAIG
eukprot:m.87692 g.87692  ORF g.87692 m.87692 type:complete len:579 (+) comp9720_c0_seq2:301-2037(+)